MSWAARPIRYNVKRNIETTFAARVMRWGGLLLALAFGPGSENARTGISKTDRSIANDADLPSKNLNQQNY
jgi:hypothetical protein